jgi:hypothetical protein
METSSSRGFHGANFHDALLSPTFAKGLLIFEPEIRATDTCAEPRHCISPLRIAISFLCNTDFVSS